jgi:PAS domain S-box-containing protein
MNDHDGDVLSIGGPGSRPVSSNGARVSGSERTLPDRDLHLLLDELRRHNADLERQNRELRRVQLELAASRDRYWDLWAHAPMGCLTLDGQGRMLDVNLAASVLLGAARPRLLGRALAEWLDDVDADALYEARRAAVLHAPSASCRVRLARPDGRAIPALLRSTAVRGEHGRTEWLTVIVDETAAAQR